MLSQSPAGSIVQELQDIDLSSCLPPHRVRDAVTAPENLPNAPIVEAVIDIGVEFSKAPDQERLAAFQDRLEGRYPNKQVRNAWSGRFEFRPDKEPVARADGGPVGYLFRSADAKQVIQARRNGFGFSRTKPYQDWESFSIEAKALWNRYRTFTKPKKVNRVGLRYINRMALPLPFADFSEYLLTAPEIAAGLPQAMASFFFRVVLPDEESKAVIVITETIDEAESNPQTVSVIFDIDVFRSGTFPVEGDKLWPVIERLHDVKNRVFFESITDKAKELFK